MLMKKFHIRLSTEAIQYVTSYHQRDASILEKRWYLMWDVSNYSGAAASHFLQQRFSNCIPRPFSKRSAEQQTRRFI